ncbi:MAG: response regulator transcription factor [Gemmatimonadaceae bacterium]
MTTIPVSPQRFVVPADQLDALVLIIDDEPQIRAALSQVLEERGARVVAAATAAEGMAIASAERPDLIILDLGLPDASGDVVCKEVRSWSRIPIVVLSARHSEAEKVRLLDLGADDYLTKPFGSMELVARVRAHLRRVASVESEAPVLIRAGDVEIDFHRRGAFRNGERIHLTPLEWSLLRTMASQAGRTLTHRQLFDAVWARSHGNASQYLRVFITALRKKIEPDSSAPQLIVTEPGVGYRFEIPRAT